MRPPLDDSSLSRALRELPRVDTSPGFQSRVLQAWDRRQQERPIARPYRWALASGLLAAVAIILAIGLGLRQSDRRELARKQQILQQYLELQEELHQLQSLSEHSDAVLYLASDEDLDVVLDLYDIVGRQLETSPAVGDYRPAAANLSETGSGRRDR